MKMSKSRVPRSKVYQDTLPKYLHCPEREDAFFMEEDARLLLMLLPLDHVQEGGGPLVGNLTKS